MCNVTSVISSCGRRVIRKTTDDKTGKNWSVFTNLENLEFIDDIRLTKKAAKIISLHINIRNKRYQSLKKKLLPRQMKIDEIRGTGEDLRETRTENGDIKKNI